LVTRFVSRLGLTVCAPVLAASVVALVVAFVAFLTGWVGSGFIVAPPGRVTHRAVAAFPRAHDLDALLAVLCPRWPRAFPSGTESCPDPLVPMVERAEGCGPTTEGSRMTAMPTRELPDMWGGR
jgi:hypothetical protein